MRYFAMLAALGLAIAIPASTPAFAEAAPEISIEADQLAARGYDVTAYFLQGKPVRGSKAYQLQYKGATWRFASADALAKFKAGPGAFEPQFGGYCAWAVSQGYVAPGDPEQWKIVDGKLYLNFNARAKELWEADQAEAIKRGHANWPGVLTKNQENP
ncbi:MAG TPA: YHS domain-containing (seleno)protein [Sphingomicrobium sp.]|nr:YHS domain-containing (seleno)protein [Sphingomicrobium sp.]